MFNQAIVREAVDFANKVLLMADPDIQQQHERGMEQIRQGKFMTLDELREKLELR
jgi:hypothetical protein